jgi:SNF2 family DNA or RNA helicase
MKILHGTWIPQAEENFVQGGTFYLWVETIEGKKSQGNIHPRQLKKAELAEFLEHEAGIKLSAVRNQFFKKLEQAIEPQHFLLPTADQQPLPSLELARYLETELPETFEGQYWQVDCFAIATHKLIKVLNDLHFTTLYSLTEVQFGSDLLFWHHYTQSFKQQIILRDQYIPSLRYREIPAAPVQNSKTTKATQGRKKAAEAMPKETKPSFEILPGWEIISSQYETNVKRYAEWMPLVCVSGFDQALDTPKFYDRERLLRHFSDCLITLIVDQTPIPIAYENKVSGTLIDACLHKKQGMRGSSLEEYRQWKTWRDRITRNQAADEFSLCFQLRSPEHPSQPWILEFQVASKQDPSLRIPLQDYWQSRTTQRKKLQKQFGGNFEQHLLTNLGYAARIYPQLWTGLETDEPAQIHLTLDDAFTFLQESAWVLEDTGYKVIVPAWWTPKGRQRAKIRLQAKGRGIQSSGSDKKGFFSADSLVEYKYELAIGGERVSEQEWQALVNAKTPLVQFRGQWMELDRDKMQEMLEFWKKHRQENPNLSLAEYLKMTAEGEASEQLEVESDRPLSEMMEKLNDKSRLELITDPANFQGKLRDYQKRGVSWLSYLESLGLNGCLADDMGLGKSAQVIARLLQEREASAKKGRGKSIAPSIPPTLLIAPTSVVGNWQKEMEKFAPELRSIVHHGAQRLQDAKAFKAALQDCDVFITSFTLARKDEKLLSSVEWHRLVLDEAQNIKNPKAAQTKAILKLPATHRLALTGTPVENRLLDLWSIFNFLNPGYLGKEAQFRQSFEVPIQKNSDRTQSATLKKLVEPFILRRVKTDQSIIQDLPDKVEQKLYCNLTREQASLYEAIVKEVEEDLDAAKGMKRKGMILATLLKLKQICNHPRQFLQDESEFTPERSHKLERLVEMIEEVKAEGESLLVFTQFTELGSALEKYIKQVLHYNTYYIHGGTPRDKREQMIAEFQDPESEPSVFILSLKAGGVGITLTKANHVFHFDRWWNPAVEDQATDRAFRIGQKKNVFVHKFVAIGTLEEKIDQMIEEKKKLAGSIIGADESWLTELDNEAFKKLIRLNKNAVLD